MYRLRPPQPWSTILWQIWHRTDRLCRHHPSWLASPSWLLWLVLESCLSQLPCNLKVVDKNEWISERINGRISKWVGVLKYSKMPFVQWKLICLTEIWICYDCTFVNLTRRCWRKKRRKILKAFLYWNLWSFFDVQSEDKYCSLAKKIHVMKPFLSYAHNLWLEQLLK